MALARNAGGMVDETADQRLQRCMKGARSRLSDYLGKAAMLALSARLSRLLGPDALA
jgi:hypothetical protein